MQDATKNSEFVSREQYDKLQSEYHYIKDQLTELKRLVFGSKSERFENNLDDAQQLSLFDTALKEEAAQVKEQISYSRNKTKKNKHQPVRKVLAAHLPRVEETIEPEELEQGSKKIGQEVTEVLEYTPGSIFVRKIIRPKYAKPDNQGVCIGELPSLPLPKSNAGASMLSHILVSKFIDHLPLYRQIQIFKRQSLYLSSSTLNNWFNGASDLLEPLYGVLEKELLSCDYLQIDESPIGVMDSDKKGALHSGYQWVFRSPAQKIVMFKYHKSRSKQAPEQVLENFKGTLQTDGYQVYQNLSIKENIIHVACWAHARRYFEKALNNDNKRASYILNEIQKLYQIERKARESEINFEVRRRYRQLFAKPILNKLQIWLKENILQTTPKSAIGKAINYTLNLWESLVNYIEHGSYEIDNNLIENSIRPLALGRKNYLFAGSHKAAQNAAMMYSFFATCKINSIEPLAWLTDVLNRIQEHKANKLTELLPQNWKPKSD
ncbi:MAG: IS66 family transposase [Colwellia sp.]|nr:IS66 family transposase [Colwellia sp.]